MNKLVQKDLQFFLAQQGGADRFLHFGRKMTDAIDIHLSFNQNAYVCSPSTESNGWNHIQRRILFGAQNKRVR